MAAAAVDGRVVIGVDVGTGSVRAGVVDPSNGRLRHVHKHPIHTWTPLAEHFEQSSDEIWRAVAVCVRAAMAGAGVGADGVGAIAFDATCSLVCVGAEGRAVGVDPTAAGAAERNVMLWADHRAVLQAAAINAGAHERLRTVGGTISPEMAMPKLLWLKEHMPSAFATVNAHGHFFELPDYLVYRASDRHSTVRSHCSLVCKWNYDPSTPSSAGVGWDRSFLASIGFTEAELLPHTIGEAVRLAGEPVDGGVGPLAAAELGLLAGTPLAVGLIDAHAGGVGCLGAPLRGTPRLDARLALICGTSTCHMASSAAPCFARGVWGPYFAAMFAGLYLNEGGQSAAGALLDHLVRTHPAAAELGEPPHDAVHRRLEQLARARGVPLPCLAADVHVTPDFLGNRSPLADPQMRGGVVGLPLSASVDDLALLYLAAVQSLAYQTKQIVRAMEGAGHTPFEAVVACGGLAKNSVYIQAHADALRLPIFFPKEEEAVLLGAAVLAAVAGGIHPSVPAAMAAMTAVGDEVAPSTDALVQAYHERKYKVFLRMTDDQRAYRAMMNTSA